MGYEGTFFEYSFFTTLEIWVLTKEQTGHCLLTIEIFTYPVTCAAWAPNGESFVLGSQDPDHPLCLYSTNGEKLYSWTGTSTFRVNDLAISPDGQRLVVLLEQRIFVYDFVSREKICEYALEDVKLTSITITKNSRHMLVSMNDNKIRIMDIDTGEVLQSYSGQKQTQYIIRSTFGGADENFVLSGSEGE